MWKKTFDKREKKKDRKEEVAGDKSKISLFVKDKVLKYFGSKGNIGLTLLNKPITYTERKKK